ncbi:MAG: type II secretion system F family protein [Actinomycetota bacterium]|nr:type II secretion system F family protein [Actinomycetota bacterium]
MSSAVLLAFVAGVAGLLGAWNALIALEHVPLRGGLARVLEPLQRAGTEGRDATAAERRRLMAVAVGALLAGGWLVGGVIIGLITAMAGPAIVVMILRARRHRYALELAAGAAEAARALADAVAAGHSARGAIPVAAPALKGATGRELRAVAQALGYGEPTDAALEKLRRRARCTGWDALCAAILLQRDAGGDLAGLLRRLAVSLEASARGDAEARTATAQARFTAWTVIAMPLGAAGLAELASPGFVSGLLSHPLSAWLSGMALVLEVTAIACVRVITRPRLA